jgi:hypothetical protein
MFKKAGVVAAAVAGVLMVGGPAFANDSQGVNNADDGQLGLVNLNDIDIAKDIDLNGVLGVCGNNVGVLGAAVPILSPQATGSCAAGEIDD